MITLFVKAYKRDARLFKTYRVKKNSVFGLKCDRHADNKTKLTSKIMALQTEAFNCI